MTPQPTPRAPDLAERIYIAIFDHINSRVASSEHDTVPIIRTVLRDSVERGELAGVLEALKAITHPDGLSSGPNGLRSSLEKCQQALAAIERLGGDKV